MQALAKFRDTDCDVLIVFIQDFTKQKKQREQLAKFISLHFKVVFRLKVVSEVFLLLQTLGRYISVVSIYLLKRSKEKNSVNLTWQILCFGQNKKAT